MKILSMIIRWIFIALLLLCALGWCPSLTSLLLLLAAIVLLPIKPIDEGLKKIKLFPWVRGIIAAVLFVIAFCVAPETPPATAERIANENAAAQAQAEEDDDDYEYDTASDVARSWTYSEEQALITVYEFNADGTWRMESEGGAENYGTYEIIDDCKIVMKGEYGDHEFTIFDVKVLLDDDGKELIPYDPDASYEDDDYYDEYEDEDY